MYEKDQMTTSALLEFSILKIINRIAKMGKDLKEVYASWDIDKSGFCKYYNLPSFINLVDATEIMKGVTQSLGITLSREESKLLTEYLDKDGDARVSYSEFS